MHLDAYHCECVLYESKASGACILMLNWLLHACTTPASLQSGNIWHVEMIQDLIYCSISMSQQTQFAKDPFAWTSLLRPARPSAGQTLTLLRLTHCSRKQRRHPLQRQCAHAAARFADALLPFSCLAEAALELLQQSETLAPYPSEPPQGLPTWQGDSVALAFHVACASPDTAP